MVGARLNRLGVCKGLSFHQLLASEKLRKAWIIKIRRETFPSRQTFTFAGYTSKDIDIVGLPPMTFP